MYSACEVDMNFEELEEKSVKVPSSISLKCICEVLTPSTSTCDCTWRSGVSRSN